MTAAIPILTVDGYGVSLTVRRGRLQIYSCIAAGRTLRELSRADRAIRRIVILADTGNISLDALRWCADVGIAVVQLDRDSRLLMTNAAPGTDDARLRRAQAAVASSKVGVDIARALLLAKLDGQGANLADMLGSAAAAQRLLGLCESAAVAGDLRGLRDLEATASNLYFGSWAAHVGCTFAADYADSVPGHWQYFGARRSPLHVGRTNRVAADPINALLNYGYALAEAECRIAAVTVGLDPGLGIVHTDKRDRDSLALDLLEPLRPIVDRHVLRLLNVRRFTSADFAETRQGACRVLEPLTHELSELMPDLARAVAPIAEQVAHALARSSPGKIELRTPLSRANNRRAQLRVSREAARAMPVETRPLPNCRTCGARLYDARRKLCSICWPVHRAALAHQRANAGQEALRTARAAGHDPGQTIEARARRSEALVRMKAAEARWREAGVRPTLTERELHETVIPGLQGVPLRRIQAVTGLSDASCSRIRSRKMTPHPRHWDALMQLALAVETRA